jgi:hypothetical protein
MLAVSGLLMGFFDRWWHIELEPEDEFCALVVVGFEGVVFGFTAEVWVGVQVVWVMQLSE